MRSVVVLRALRTDFNIGWACAGASLSHRAPASVLIIGARRAGNRSWSSAEVRQFMDFEMIAHAF
jgi:hypothetical protein